MKNVILALLCSFGLLACSSSKEATDMAGAEGKEEMAEKAEKAEGMKHEAKEMKEDAEHHANEAEEKAEHHADEKEEGAEHKTKKMKEMKETAEGPAPPLPATPLPEMTGPLTPVTIEYGVMISVDQGDFPMEMTTVVKEEGDLWSVSQTMATPQGDVSDVCLITKDTFESRKRSMAQGPMGIDITYENGKATGVIQGGPTPTDINADMAGPVFCGGSAMPFVVSHLPLKAGYTTLLPIFDPSAQMGRDMSLTVSGEETLTLESGSYETYKVDLKLAEGAAGGDISMWVSKGDNPVVVKMMQAIPQMNGLMVTELKSSN